MPTNIGLGDIWEVKVGCYYGGQAGINISHWKATTAVTGGATDQELAGSMNTSFAGPYKAAMGGQATYYGVRVQRVFPLPLTAAVVLASTTGPGTFGMECMPSVVSGLIRLTTAVAGRSGRGRQYIPFPAKTAHDSATNTPTAAYQTALTAIAAIFNPFTLTGMTGSNQMVPGIYNRGVHSCQAITGNYCPPLWASQHKRGNFGTANIYPPF